MEPITIAILGGLSGMFGYGIADFFAKKAVDKIGTFRSLLISQFIGFLFIGAFLFMDSSLPPLTLHTLMLALIFGVTDALGYLAFYKAIEVGKVSVMSPLISSYVLLSGVLSFIVFSETFPAMKLVSIILVISGIIMTVIDPKELKTLHKAEVTKGLPYAIVAFVIFGFWYVFWDSFIDGEGWLFWTFIVRGILVVSLLAYNFIKSKRRESGGIRPLIPTLIAMAVLDAIAIIGEGWAFNATTNLASVIIAITAAYPLVTVILAYIFLKERLAWTQYVGIGLILAGLALMPFI